MIYHRAASLYEGSHDLIALQHLPYAQGPPGRLLQAQHLPQGGSGQIAEGSVAASEVERARDLTIAGKSSEAAEEIARGNAQGLYCWNSLDVRP